MTILAMIEKMSEGLGRTCSIFFLTLLFSLPLGLVVAMLRRSRFAPVRGIMKVFISVLRGTPLMLQLLAVAYGPFYISRAIVRFAETVENPQFAQFLNDFASLGVFSVARNKLFPLIIGFSLNYAAYFAEIYRGGIESMPVGQYEAAAVLGYSKFQTFMRIILPQVIKRILPSITNEVITLVKDTSLAFTLAYQEMFTIGKQIASSKASFMPFIIAGVFYYIFNSVVAFTMSRIEKRMNYYH